MAIKPYLVFLFLLSCSPLSASYVDFEWDASTSTNLSGYRLFYSTATSMLQMSTTTATADPRITKRLVGVQTVVRQRLSAGTTYYARLTAVNTALLQSEFNVLTSTNPIPHEVTVYLKPGDVNRDGSVGITDLSMVISYWGSTIRPEADFNNDGRVNIVDLSILIASWGQ